MTEVLLLPMAPPSRHRHQHVLTGLVLMGSIWGDVPGFCALVITRPFNECHGITKRNISGWNLYGCIRSCSVLTNGLRNVTTKLIITMPAAGRVCQIARHVTGRNFTTDEMLVLREMGSTTTYGQTVRERFGTGVAAAAAGVNATAGGCSVSLRSRCGREVAGLMCVRD